MGFEDISSPPADPVCRKDGILKYRPEQAARVLGKPARHRNITLKRLFLDSYQFLRAQSFISHRFGRPYRPSQKYAEVDITYKCNLQCINCNRSCSQAPSNIEMPVAQVVAFIQQSIEKRIAWERIRILGGEPTLHSRFLDIIELLLDYRRRHIPAVRLVLSTNFLDIACVKRW